MAVPSPVLQTNFSPEQGDALAACVASILGKPLGEVPNFIAEEGGYWPSMLRHAASAGLAMLKLPLSDGKLPFPTCAGSLCIVRGTSPRGPHGHVIVSRVAEDGMTLTPVHDPHPDSTYLHGPGQWCAFYIAPQPKQFMQ